MHLAISPIIRVATSCMIPWPICATRPLTSRSRRDLDADVPVVAGSATLHGIVACALPWPRASFAFARSIARALGVVLLLDRDGAAVGHRDRAQLDLDTSAS